ncbi:bifunctional DNA primase/helicase [Stenotrophomonas phage Philippe]|uniref:Bifunctional DNA primase/helicase n=1 Tax=Stenotrophomonas phage Philippe TaxID=2859655 RepID=A0AAE7WMN8_9CAUD|nr:bifunctional DNA primase/helicase [Stenotrophomonas phage Philippe]QYW02265.1 bifunctional DNA primase/helicase [Stenotrophomonas phage Philippe]
MIDLTGVKHHQAVEELVDVLCNRTQNTDKGFFRVEVAFFLCKMASCMRAFVHTKDRGDIPVNSYALALATSGFGKGHSVRIVEEEVIKEFQTRFTKETLPILTEQTLWDMAHERAAHSQLDPNDEFESLRGEAQRAGTVPFTFDSGTVPAVKQMRHKLLLTGAGSINLQIDEIGSNLLPNMELMNLFLELFDQGAAKGKLTKNTAENTRTEEVDGKTPANLLMFGTGTKLFDGAQTEDMFYSFLETGYARRCLFGIGKQDKKSHHTLTPEEIYDRLTQPTNSVALQKWSKVFHGLADPDKHKWRMEVDRDVGIQLLTYKIECEKAAEQMKDHEEIRKAEISHRYFKALKLAGAYAFVDGSFHVEMHHLMSAILLVEESGEAFQSILHREKTYVKLAKFLADNKGKQLTHADLHESLPFYKTGVGARNEMMTMAVAWGVRNHIVIKKRFDDGIEFFEGSTLTETNLDEMLLSYSDHWAYRYGRELAKFEDLHILTQSADLHWANHAFEKQHRAEENVIPGFNMIVLDVDGGIKLEQVHELLKDYKFMTYTTKRHTDEEHRFRVIMPTNYHLELDTEDYREFMDNILAFLPFEVDPSVNQRAKKWETCAKGQHHYNMEGRLFDVTPFIPKTNRNDQFQNEYRKLESLDNLQRWFAQRMAAGNRNNNMLKYAMVLVDSGWELPDVQKNVLEFNSKLNTPLPKDEIESTIFVSVAKKYL